MNNLFDTQTIPHKREKMLHFFLFLIVAIGYKKVGKVYKTSLPKEKEKKKKSVYFLNFQRSNFVVTDD